MNKIALVVFLATMAVTRTNAQAKDKPGYLVVTVTNFSSDKGVCRYCLFNSPDGFPGDPSKAIACSFGSIKNKFSAYVFENVEPGVYAVVAYHDENNNDELDLNFMGIPKEKYAVSNNARSSLGPPKFDAAKFVHTRSEYKLKIVMND
jgi:uncharacterized protein (DUF2141 family)